MKRKTILGAAIGSCVHIAGLNHFLKIAESEGFDTVMLGPAVPLKILIDKTEKLKPDIVALSYRLSPGPVKSLLKEIEKLAAERKLKNITYIFGGTPPVAEIAQTFKFIDKVFNGRESIFEIRDYLRGNSPASIHKVFPDNLTDRIELKYPYPLLRHHFGRPSIKETVEGIKIISESECLDVISIGPDQNAQEHFFHPEEMDRTQDGAGGVPVRSAEELKAFFEASRRGNFPLMRCYSGTNDLLRWAEMSVETIHNAWAAVPLTWYSILDGRSKRSVADAVSECRSVMEWYAERNIPFEVNESHQWSLRDAHDSLAVAMAFLAAYNARKAGVRNYVSQYMFNTPPGTSAKMDIAKMTAKKELIESLQDENFNVITEVRAGIAHFSPDFPTAKGQLASSAVISLFLRPHILHVVGYSEADHAVRPDELIESCNIVRGVLQNCLNGLPDLSGDQEIAQRKKELIDESRILLEALKSAGKNQSEDPWSDPVSIQRAVECGLLDTPHFRGNPKLSGKINTQLINGAWYAVDGSSGRIVREKERTSKILNSKS